MPASATVRPAQPRDVDVIYRWIVDLATYERAPEQVVGTVEMLRHELFGAAPSAEALIAEIDGRPAGHALFYRTFSTWECRPGLWLEDLYVPPEHRRHGVGGALLAELARITVQRGFARLEWTALNWNTPALDFYAKLGAERMEEWSDYRLAGEALARVAGAAGAVLDPGAAPDAGAVTGAADTVTGAACAAPDADAVTGAAGADLPGADIERPR